MKSCIKWTLTLMFLAACLLLTATALADTTHTHYAWCTDPNPSVCCVCGATGIDNTYHMVTAKDNGDGTHTNTCSNCGLSWSGNHDVRCTDVNKNKCRLCGAYTTCSISHAPENKIMRNNGDGTHSSYCTACKSVFYTEEHYAYCNAVSKNVCTECGAVGNVNVYHPYENRVYVSVNSVSHAEVCTVCNATIGSYEHWTNCDEKDTSRCLECGYRGNVRVYHGESVYVNKGNGLHSAVCIDCGQVAYTEGHFVYCTSHNWKICDGCNAYEPSMTVWHAEYYFVNNGDGTHTSFCLECGAEGWTDIHSTDCSNANKTVCIDCGARSSSMFINHYNQLCTDNGNGTHTSRCLDCGTVTYTEEHYAWCTMPDPSVCADCGAKNPRVYHDYDGGYCRLCGAVDPTYATKIAVMKDGKIGYEEGGIFTPATGLINYQGGLFLVDKGVIQTGKNGLVNTDKGWYYFAGGQAQTQYTGFVQYDGAWFYVTAGRMDTSSNGLYNYDGSKFLVSAGKVRYDYSGLFQNAAGNLHNADGKWYFISGGQVQTQYTGLAQYNGHWFYLVNGVLAEYYTGTVNYNGGVFSVVNGMVV